MNSSNMKVHTVVTKAHLELVTALAFLSDLYFIFNGRVRTKAQEQDDTNATLALKVYLNAYMTLYKLWAKNLCGKMASLFSPMLKLIVSTQS